ncbi:MAG: flagellar biosynthetic protein FliR [Rickettsiales bacterium]|jgi:flagellar biosynthetic protein FliR|nr:flagellar biosynthetic protein FliR [Rickettsiales bacterium]
MLSQFLTQELFTFLLIFCRVGSAIMLLPGFGESYVSTRFRLFFAVVFSILLTPVISIMPEVPTSTPVLMLLIIGEIIIGLFLGATARTIISATHIAGTIIALQSSLASALVQDMSQIQGQSSIISNLLGITALVLIFSFDLHHVMLKGLVGSYTTFTPGQFPIMEDMANQLTTLMNGAFTAALQISAPHIVIGVIIYLGAGIVARLVPNIQVFFILMPPQILISIVVLMITFSSIMLWYVGHFKDSLGPLGSP